MPLSIHITNSRVASRKVETKSKNVVSGANITPGEKVKWEHVGTGGAELYRQLKEMYWDGVGRDLKSILWALKKWQDPSLTALRVEDEADELIHGFDTFVDQVGQTSRIFANRYKEARKTFSKTKGNKTNKTYKDSIREEVLDQMYAHTSAQIKSQIHDELEDRKSGNDLQAIARMLLQSAGFLDMDKLIAHREPMANVTFWKRPGIPQLRLERVDGYGTPVFQYLWCGQCKDVIRGSIFVSREETSQTICETCYRGNPSCYRSDKFTKAYKHCILDEAIKPEVSRRMCDCRQVPRFDKEGRSLALFPVEKVDGHFNADPRGGLRCGLLTVGEVVARTKCDGLQTTVLDKTAKPHKTKVYENTNESTKKAEKKGAPKQVTGQSLQNPKTKDMTQATTTVLEEEEAKEDIPFYLRKYTDKVPFGNIHMALRFGPLVFENGVEHTGGGALVTLRDRLQLGAREPPEVTTRALTVGNNSDRTVCEQKKYQARTERYKATLKQIVGVPFSGVLDQTSEHDIVETILNASKEPFDSPSKPFLQRQKILAEAVETIRKKLKALISPILNVFLQSLTDRLLDPKINLRWNERDNHCQTFCDSLIDRSLFGSLVYSRRRDVSIEAPLYIISFICRPDSYLRDRIRTKFDVPNGLTEEYLLKFHYGRHDEADIIDTLQEYWHDWAAFESAPYRYQDIFPWDCTEAFGRYEGTCNECNLSKHVWAFPFDAWSISALHLLREPCLYPGQQTNQSWLQNRLTVLRAQEYLLAAATAMSRLESFHAATDWLLKQDDESLDRLKLGGIHRAQPFSHFFDFGTYYHYFLADWVHLPHAERIRRYEELRDGRVRMRDVPQKRAPREWDDVQDDGGGWDSGGFADGASDAGFSVADSGIADGNLDAGLSEGFDAGIADGADAGGIADGADTGGTADGTDGGNADAGGGGGDGAGDGGCGGGGGDGCGG